MTRTAPRSPHGSTPSPGIRSSTISAPGAELPDDLPDAAGIDDGLLQRESLQALGEALNRLDERLRALIVLRYGKGLSLKDTAARLGVSYAYVKILHSNALKTLRECFEAPIK